jgi:hypothetical protein
LTKALLANSSPLISFTRDQTGTINLTKPLTLKGLTAGRTSFYIKATTLGNIAATGEVTLVVSDCSDSKILVLQEKGYEWKVNHKSGIYSMEKDKF